MARAAGAAAAAGAAQATQAALLAAAEKDLGSEATKQLSAYLEDAPLTAEVEEVMRHEMSESTCRNYNKRNRRLYLYLKEHHPSSKCLFKETYNGAGRDPTKFSPDDPNWLNYAELVPGVVREFMAQLKNPRTDQVSSHTDVRKYLDAIQYGATQAQAALPSGFLKAIRRYLAAYKKRFAHALQNGEVDSHASDPMTPRHFRYICQRALEDGNSFVWSWLVLQWNLMCRGKNIATLNLDLLGAEEDALIFQFVVTKAGQGGEFKMKKHCYANPLDPSVCIATALAVYLSLHPRRGGSHLLFEGQSQSARFGKLLSEVIKEEHDALSVMGLAQIHSALTGHSIRKGAASSAASGSTMCPSIIAICRRADWSLGKVLATYLFYQAAGDQFVGRTVAQLPIDSADFGVLPPHFNTTDTEVSALFQQVVMEQFPDLLKQFPHLMGVASMAVASLVYHSKFLVQYFASNKSGPAGSNPLFATPVFQDTERLGRLQSMVTIDSDGRLGCLKATGVPPTVRMMQRLEAQTQLLEENKTCLRGLCDKLQHLAGDMVAELVQGVKDGLEEDARSRGIVTISALETSLAARDLTLQAQLKTMLQQLAPLPSSGHGNPTPVAVPLSATITFTTFLHPVDQQFPLNGAPRQWCVPPDFVLTLKDITIAAAFTLWVRGNSTLKIRPYRTFTKDSFGPTSAQLRSHGVDMRTAYPDYYARISSNREHLTEWKRILLPMESVVAEELAGGALLTPSQVNDAFVKAWGVVREEFIQYACASPRHSQFMIGTWAKMMKPSSIMKSGTEMDLMNLAKRRQTSSGGKYSSSRELAVTEALAKGLRPAKYAKQSESSA